jgi:hypothetical protein
VGVGASEWVPRPGLSGAQGVDLHGLCSWRLRMKNGDRNLLNSGIPKPPSEAGC